ncbi:MAG TPA: hypothetical protein VGO93_17655 [Candidatus Xenobia bacterium]|jgi:hypothetical protein
MELTRCPQLNDLIRGVEQYQQGVRTQEELKNSLRQMESLYKVMWSAFQRQLKLYDKGTPLWQLSSEVEDGFKGLRRGLELVRGWFTDDRSERLYEGIDLARTCMDGMFVTFDKMAALEQNEPKYSENPFLHEVIRVGRGVMAGKLPGEAFKDVLARMKTLQKQTAQEILGLPTPSDDDKQLRSKVRGLMERVYSGLKEAELYFSDGRSDHIGKGLDTAQAAMKELYELKTAVEDAPPTDQVRACWRCKKDVPAHLPTCDACGFRFPVTGADGEPMAAEVVVIRTPRGHQATEVSERLVAAVEEVQMGGPVGTLLEVLEDIRRRVGLARHKLDTVAPPPLGQIEEGTAYQEAQGGIGAALDLMAAGAERLARYEADRDPEHLSEGLELVLVANDQLVEMQAPADSNG